MKLFVALIICSIAEGFTIPSYGRSVSTQLQVTGFTGFGHATGDIEEEISPTPSFTGFGHAIDPPITRQTEAASAPALSAPAPVFTGFGHATGEAVEKIETSAPVFSGFGHATRVTESASAPALSTPATGFSGFSHALNNAEPISKEPTSTFTGFGHSFAGATTSNDSAAAAAPAKSTLDEAKEFLLQATAKATKLREIMKLKENQNGSRVQQLAADLQKQEEACRSYELQISRISAEFEEYKRSTVEEQSSLKEQVAKKDVEINSALAQAKEICDLLDELSQL